MNKTKNLKKTPTQLAHYETLCTMLGMRGSYNQVNKNGTVRVKWCNLDVDFDNNDPGQVRYHNLGNVGIAWEYAEENGLAPRVSGWKDEGGRSFSKLWHCGYKGFCVTLPVGEGENKPVKGFAPKEPEDDDEG